MWQKARQLKGSQRGRTMWVQAGRPIVIPTIGIITGKPLEPEPVFQTNHIGPRTGRPTVISADYLELLPEFAKDVPLVSWEDFLNGADTESGEKR